MATINHKTYNEATETFKDFSVYDGKETLIFKVDGSEGNVGIGTTSPNKKLTVYGGNDNGIWVDSGGAQYTTIALGNAGSEKVNFAWDNTNVGFLLSSYGASYQAFSTNGSERMRITSAGNVGIGTTSPYAGMDIFQSTAGFGSWKYGLNLGATDFPALRFLATTANTGNIIAHEAGSLVFLSGTTNAAAGTERVRIDSSGNVGIGTSSPSGKLHVAGGDIFLGASYALKYNSTSYITPENNVSGAEVSTGGVFVVKTGVSPAERLRVEAQVRLQPPNCK
jgi:hypothetical protein